MRRHCGVVQKVDFSMAGKGCGKNVIDSAWMESVVVQNFKLEKN
jgi:hypothetical protein